jgi:hypothetical protein
LEPTPDYRGARGSNAGDQFHELWALERVLGLLDQATGLTAVTVEGVPAAVGIPTKDDSEWDGVDCLLLFGATTIEKAGRVDIVQLKYSGSSPNRAWSISRLAHNTGKVVNNSVLRKLADSFTTTKGQAQPASDIRVRLVSNQPADPEVVSLAEMARQGTLPANAASEALTKLSEASGLADTDLTGFLAALDLSECGTTSRFAHQERVVFAIAKLMEDNATSTAADLRLRVRQLMYPERRGEFITLETVLSWFGIADIDGLFPCPASMTIVENSIIRDVSRRIAELIQEHSNVVCLHGGGGCGKTTAMRQIQEFLPAGSCFILFDCYGGGRFLFSDDRRHLPENALLQIVNELSLTLQSPLFIPRDRLQPIDIRQFLGRIAEAAAVLAEGSPEAKLVIAIDAADNAVAAALGASPPQPCFVHELCSADLGRLPKNVRLILSARSSRLADLRLPPNAMTMECPPFTLDETAGFVRSHWPGTSEGWVEQFHHLSSGIPRVQAYAAGLARSDREVALDALRPAGKRLNEILGTQFETARNKIGDSRVFDKLLGGLALLPPPVPPAHLAAVASTSSSSVADLVSDLSPGLRMSEEGISMADEDFEDLIRARSVAAQAELAPVVAERFQALCTSDAYAATHIAQSLAAAGQGDKLLSLIDDASTLAPIADPVVRREVHLRRLRMALTACRARGSASEALKVILVSAEANREESVLRDLLERDVDLAVHFAWSTLRRLVLADRSSGGRQGSVLAHDAARAARSGDLITARERLVAYEAWLRRRKNVERNREHEWKISIDDIAAKTEAVFEVAGAEAALYELRRWRPRSIRPTVANRLVSALIMNGKTPELLEALKTPLLEEPWNLFLSVPLATAGHTIDAALISRSLNEVNEGHIPKDAQHDLNSSGDNWAESWLDTLLTACELAVALEADPQVIDRTLAAISSSLTARDAAWRPIAMDAMLRVWILRRRLADADHSIDALLQELRPHVPTGEEHPHGKEQARPSERNARQARESDRQLEELFSRVKALYPIYDGRVALLMDSRAERMSADTVRRLIPHADAGDYTFRNHWLAAGFRAQAAKSVLRLVAITALPWQALFDRAATIARGSSESPFQPHLIPLLEFLVIRDDAQAFVLEQAGSIAASTRQARAPSSEKVDHFARLSRLLLHISPPDAKSLFGSAIELSREMDQEAHDQIRLLACLSASSPMLPVDDRRAIASEVFRFISGAAERLSPYDGFPWRHAGIVLARLSTSLGFASLARWADGDLADLQTTLAPFLQEALVIGALPPNVVGALAILLDQPDDDLTRQVFLASRGTSSAVRVAEELARDCELHAAPNTRLPLSRSVVSLVDECGILPGGAIARLRETVRFLTEVTVEEPDESPVDAKTALGSNEAAAHTEVGSTSGRFTTASSIEARLTHEDSRLSSRGARDLLTEMRRAVRVADRVLHLEALCAVSDSLLWEGTRIEALTDALSAWKGAPAVEQWRQDTLPELIVKHFSSTIRWAEMGYSWFKDLLDSTNLPASDQLQIIYDCLETTNLTLESRAVFRAAEVFAETAAPAEAAKTLTWYMERLGSRLAHDPLYALDTNDVPEDAIGAIGRFLYSLMSDIDTRQRWRAAHALRRAARLDASDVLDSAVGNWDRKDDESFRLPGAHYFQLAAKLWLAMTLNRIASESPSSLIRHVNLLTEVALDTTFPHVLVREHARQAVIHLVDINLATLDAETIVSLRQIHSSPFDRIDHKGSSYRSFRRDRPPGIIFKFDTMDTLPYWYSSILRIFPDVSEEEVLQRAQDWIMGSWGAGPDHETMTNEPRRNRYNGPRAASWLHRQGELPTLERYDTYLEWHAMFCVVGELLQTHALSTAEDDYDRFESWLARHMPLQPNLWLSDVRGPTPLDPQLWADANSSDSEWLRPVDAAEFTCELGLADGTASDWIVVGGHYDMHYPARAFSVGVTSALVSPDTAPALTRALQTMRDSWDYRLPYEDDHMQINEPPYVLLGWLSDADRDPSSSFDEGDPLRHQIGRLQQAPGRVATNTLDLVRRDDSDGLCWKSSTGGQPVFKAQIWSDEPQREGNRSPRFAASSGWRLWMRAEHLKALLDREAMDLVCEVQITRRNRTGASQNYDFDRDHRVIDRVFLLRREGQIEGSSGDLGAWTATDQGA